MATKKKTTKKKAAKPTKTTRATAKKAKSPQKVGAKAKGKKRSSKRAETPEACGQKIRQSFIDLTNEPKPDPEKEPEYYLGSEDIYPTDETALYEDYWEALVKVQDRAQNLLENDRSTSAVFELEVAIINLVKLGAPKEGVLANERQRRAWRKMLYKLEPIANGEASDLEDSHRKVATFPSRSASSRNKRSKKDLLAEMEHVFEKDMRGEAQEYERVRPALTKHVESELLQDCEKLLKLMAPGPKQATQAVAAAERNKTETEEYIFRRDGDTWTLRYEGKQVSGIVHRKGMAYIAHLLRNPLEQVSVFALRKLTDRPRASRSVQSEPVDADETEYHSAPREPIRYEDRNTVVDDECLDRLAEELKNLRSDLDDAQADNDEMRAINIRGQITKIQKYLKSSTAPGKRIRKAVDERQKARLSVKRSIDRAIEHLSKSHTPLSEHLERTIRTGNSCSYITDKHIPWQF